MAFPVVANIAASERTTNGTAHTVSLPINIASGDLLIVAFSVDQIPTVTWPTGWTELFAQSNSNQVRFEVRYRVADGTEGASISLTTSTSEKSSHQSWRITGYQGAPEAGTVVTGVDNAPDPPSLSPSWGVADTLWIALEGNDGSILATGFPSTYPDNQRTDESGANGTGIASATRNFNAASDDPGTFTLEASEQWVANTIAVRPAGGPTIVDADGSSSGAAVVSALALALWLVDGSASGLAAVSGDGVDAAAGSDGASSGTSVVSSVGVALWNTAAASSGVAAGDGLTLAIATSEAISSGVAVSTGLALAIANSEAVAAGLGAVDGVSGSTWLVLGSAVGTGAANGQGEDAATPAAGTGKTALRSRQLLMGVG